MRISFKKCLALLLSIALLAVLATSCANETAAPAAAGTVQTTQASVATAAASSSAVSTQSVQSAGTSAASVPANAEPIDIVVFNNSGGYGGAGSEAGSTADSIQLVHDKILEETNVNLISIVVPSTEWTAKLASLLSSNEELDMWWGNWSQYSDDGIIQPINEYLDQYGADVYDVWDQWDAWARCTDVDGTIWAVPRYTQFCSYFSFVRTDWLEKLNMEMPTTLAEYEEYLYAVKDADFYGNGETIPLIGRGGNVSSSFEWAMLGGFTDAGCSSWIDENGNVMPKELQDGYQDFIAKLHQWYTDGIIHKENFGWDTAKVREMISSGRVGASMAYYVDVSQFNAVMQQNFPEANFAHYEKGLTGPNGQLIQTLNPGTSKQMLFSAKSSDEKMTAMMKLVNWCFADWYNYKTVCSGIEGVQWEYDTGVVDLATAQKQYVVKAIPNSGYYGDFCLSIGLPYESMGIIYNTDGSRYMHNLYLAEYLDDFDICKQTLDAKITFNSTELSDNIPTLNDMNTYINEELVKFVTGDRDLSTWDSFVSDLENIGLDDWSKEYTKQYNLLTGK